MMEKINIIDPFSISFKESKALSVEELDKIFNQAYEKNKWFIEEYFKKHTNINWLMIAGKEKNIIDIGPSGTEPTDEQIENRSKIKNKLIFVYYRPKEQKSYFEITHK